MGFDGGRSAVEADGVGFGPVGYAEEEAEVFGRKSACGIVLVEAGDAGLEGPAEGFVGVVGVGAVDNVGNELEGEG